MVFTRDGGPIPAVVDLPTDGAWREHLIPWSEFGSDGSAVTGIALVGGPAAGPFSLFVDRVELR